MLAREIGALHWDNRLTLEFNGSRPCVASLEIKKIDDAVTVFLAAMIAKEKVGRAQRLGIAIIILGLPLLATFREIASRSASPQWNQTLGSM